MKPKKKKRRQNGPISRLIRFIQPALIFCLLHTLGRLDTRPRMMLARALSYFVFYFLPIRKKVALDQLQRSIPELSVSEARDAIRRSYAHVICMAIEYLHMVRCPLDSIERGVVNVEAIIDHLNQIKDSGHGAILITGHMGNVDWVAYCASHLGYDLCAAVKAQHNPVVEMMISNMRTRHGMRVIRTSDHPLRAMGQLIKTLRSGGIVPIPGDQDARKAGIFVEFFGRPASTFTGAAWLSYKTGCPILPVWIKREPDGMLRAEIGSFIHPDPEAESDSEIRRITEIHVKLLEETIRKDPGQYLWFHKRWKTQPKPKKS